MWKDDKDEIDNLYVNLKKIKKFPTRCPVCGKNSAHLYMNIHNFETRRGGLWVWCSECYTFSHSSIYVPEYWENSLSVELEKLCAVPEYLNEIKDEIDNHANMIINNMENAY